MQELFMKLLLQSLIPTWSTLVHLKTSPGRELGLPYMHQAFYKLGLIHKSPPSLAGKFTCVLPNLPL